MLRQFSITMTLDELNRDLPALKRRFLEAKPYPHVVIDNFLDPQLAEEVCEAFPKPEEMRVHGGDPTVLKGWQVNPKDENYLPKPPLEAMFTHIQSAGMRRWITELSGSKTAALCDPDYVGAGLLAAKDKGIHKIHLDRNRHPNGQFCARLVMLIYFNKGWQPDYGGLLELWDRRILRCDTVEPLFNRCVIFENARFAYHSISDVHLPPGMTRKALNFYFYTRDLPRVERNMYVHNTEFFPRPHERAAHWRKSVTSNFPKGLATTLMLQTLPTAKLYHWLKRSAGRAGSSPHLAPPEAIEKAWSEYNAGRG
jgi:Rps23 Pro-64 3,4-dihydroxylase Tpa1-like proline 4-hydroxylase